MTIFRRLGFLFFLSIGFFAKGFCLQVKDLSSLQDMAFGLGRVYPSQKIQDVFAVIVDQEINRICELERLCREAAEQRGFLAASRYKYELAEVKKARAKLLSGFRRPFNQDLFDLSKHPEEIEHEKTKILSELLFVRLTIAALWEDVRFCLKSFPVFRFLDDLSEVERCLDERDWREAAMKFAFLAGELEQYNFLPTVFSYPKMLAKLCEIDACSLVVEPCVLKSALWQLDFLAFFFSGLCENSDLPGFTDRGGFFLRIKNYSTAFSQFFRAAEFISRRSLDCAALFCEKMSTVFDVIGAPGFAALSRSRADFFYSESARIHRAA